MSEIQLPEVIAAKYHYCVFGSLGADMYVYGGNPSDGNLPSGQLAFKFPKLDLTVGISRDKSGLYHVFFDQYKAGEYDSIDSVMDMIRARWGDGLIGKAKKIVTASCHRGLACRADVVEALLRKYC